ncbi:hypothetical protein [Cryobacterium arcticum]|uniref:hypothetical protein n=1 Tax=Cryobacterium arcticum TaxID=670052 RepID=UPI0012ED47A9|nr:hypothetical protein [Cryobacterium arcticum]
MDSERVIEILREVTRMKIERIGDQYNFTLRTHVEWLATMPVKEIEELAASVSLMSAVDETTAITGDFCRVLG